MQLRMPSILTCKLSEILLMRQQLGPHKCLQCSNCTCNVMQGGLMDAHLCCNCEPTAHVSAPVLNSEGSLF